MQLVLQSLIPGEGGAASFPGRGWGEGGTGPIFDQYHSLLTCLGQRKNERCPVLKPVLAIAIEQIHVIGFCILGVPTKFILQIRQTNLEGNALLTDSHKIMHPV